jgi:hypothetical protein
MFNSVFFLRPAPNFRADCRVIRDAIYAATKKVQTVSHVFGSPGWSRTSESSLPGGSVDSAPDNPGGRVYGERMYAFVICAK